MASNDRVQDSNSNILTGLVVFGVTGFFVVSSGVILVKDITSGITIGQNFTRNIEYAISDTNPVKAAERLDLAAKFMSDNNLDTGNSCTFIYSPGCDRAEYYRKLTEASADLRSVADADPLTQSNMMIRIRESFTTYGDKGQENVNHPILRFAYSWGSHTLGFWLEWYMLIALVIAGSIAFIALDTWAKS